QRHDTEGFVEGLLGFDVIARIIGLQTGRPELADTIIGGPGAWAPRGRDQERDADQRLRNHCMESHPSSVSELLVVCSTREQYCKLCPVALAARGDALRRRRTDRGEE